VPARVLAQGSSHLVGSGPLAQLRDAPAVEDGLAIDGVLKPSSVASRWSTRASSVVIRRSPANVPAAPVLVA
jgi:hypothetical protein